MACSDERKAVETAAAIGRGFTVDARLREIERPYASNEQDFRSLVLRYLCGEAVEGWESHASALARFESAATGIVVSHGTVMSLFVSARCGVDAADFWTELRMPDAWQLDNEGLVRLDTQSGAIA